MMTATVVPMDSLAKVDQIEQDTRPLPPNWEMAYTDAGEPYFIEWDFYSYFLFTSLSSFVILFVLFSHNTGTTHWTDPRSSDTTDEQQQQSFGASSSNVELLPYGWERVEDPQYGIYYVDHINKKTQYDKPELTADDAAAEGPHKLLFTRNPNELRGELITVTLVKGPKGLGFTLVGNDVCSSDEEFLQIKNVLPGGPAYRNGRLRMGDILVHVNEICVLGYTQDEVIRVFQTIAVGQQVELQVCRGYPLLFDPSDPANDFVTQDAYSSVSGSDHSVAASADLAVRVFNTEVRIVKGSMGFGFTIADSPFGQKVKKILDRPRCQGLAEGDILCEVNGNNVRTMNHTEIVDVLRDCPVGRLTTIVVQRLLGEQMLLFSFVISKQLFISFFTCIQEWTPRTTRTIPCVQNSRYFASATPNYVPAAVYTGRYTTRSAVPLSTSGFFHDVAGLENQEAAAYEHVTVNLLRQAAGFGFRLCGGTEENSQVRVGQLVADGAAFQDGRLQLDDEIVQIDGHDMLGSSHQRAVQLMNNASKNGHVKLVVRRRRRKQASSGRIINGSPAARCGHLRVGDRIVAVNGISILNMPHGDIVNLIKDSGYVVTLSVGSPDAEIDAPSSNYDRTANGTMVGVRLPSNSPTKSTPKRFSSIESVLSELNRASPPICESLEYDCIVVSEPPTPARVRWNSVDGGEQPSTSDFSFITRLLLKLIEDEEYFAVELQRGAKGFGFSIRGGREFSNMPLFVLRIAEGGPADLDHRLQVGDQLLEINGVTTANMTHAEAIELIKRESSVRLLVRRLANVPVYFTNMFFFFYILINMHFTLLQAKKPQFMFTAFTDRSVVCVNCNTNMTHNHNILSHQTYNKFVVIILPASSVKKYDEVTSSISPIVKRNIQLVLCCNQSMKVKRFSDFSQIVFVFVIVLFVSIVYLSLLLIIFIIMDGHDLETNATKEWHVRNIIPLLKVMYFKK
ncbi:putative PDZ domain protein [Trichinella spiralis]|uniref:putative PDZ domain protein n=1 Tax=Trichinella spiralis TaxID=6334 RepID=UPI0001EFCFC2|nr:putative PDZ domain protein [Trichinella spiralis]